MILSTANVVAAAYALVTGIFGMNIPYTWNEDHPEAFTWVSVNLNLECFGMTCLYTFSSSLRLSNQTPLWSVDFLTNLWGCTSGGGDDRYCLLRGLHRYNRLCTVQAPPWELTDYPLLPRQLYCSTDLALHVTLNFLWLQFFEWKRIPSSIRLRLYLPMLIDHFPGGLSSFEA